MLRLKVELDFDLWRVLVKVLMMKPTEQSVGETLRIKEVSPVVFLFLVLFELDFHYLKFSLIYSSTKAECLYLSLSGFKPKTE